MRSNKTDKSFFFHLIFVLPSLSDQDIDFRTQRKNYPQGLYVTTVLRLSTFYYSLIRYTFLILPSRIINRIMAYTKSKQPLLSFPKPKFTTGMIRLSITLLFSTLCIGSFGQKKSSITVETLLEEMTSYDKMTRYPALPYAACSEQLRSQIRFSRSARLVCQ